VTRRVDVAVVGAGIVGLAAADALLRRGARVACLDPGWPGHGQSAGAARGFRHLHAEPALMRLAVESCAGWRAWEARGGTELLERGGALRLGGDPEAASAALAQAGVPSRVLTRPQARVRLPWLADGAEPLLFDPDAGALRARPAFATLRAWVGEALVSARVDALVPAGDGVLLATSTGSIACRTCLVCAGAGTERLIAPLGLDLERERRAHLRLTFPARAPAAAPVPVWADRSERFGATAYGAPEGPDRYAVGLGVHDAYPTIDDPAASAVPGGIDLRDARRRLLAYVAAAFPGLEPHPVDAVLRLTTTLPEGDDAFVLRERDGVLALAGHNLFKHAPRLGELLADAALDGTRHPVLRS
jgi:sarcosine oxidase